MFVHLPGRSRAEAFRIGAEIAAAVTAQNPRPVKLQFEKARGGGCAGGVGGPLFPSLSLFFPSLAFPAAALPCFPCCNVRPRVASRGAFSAQVYHPCFLVTKKRYCGMMYESPGQAAPTFDAKGIETVRRDSCPAVAKMLERGIRLLAASNDLSRVKARGLGGRMVVFPRLAGSPRGAAPH